MATDVWSSRTYLGYINFTGHCIDCSWNTRSTILVFESDMTPLTGEACEKLLYEAMESWDLLQRVISITTDNGFEVVSGVSKLRLNMNNIVESPIPSIENFHVRCIAHVVSIAVEDFLFLFESE